MYVVRFIAVVLVLLSAPIAGVASAAHMSSSHDVGDLILSDTGSSAHADCCDASTDHMQSCHTFSVIASDVSQQDVTRIGRASAYFLAMTLPTGIEPAGPLDPPRAG